MSDTQHEISECREYHDVVRDYDAIGSMPRIVCLCGSTRFKDEFLHVQRELTLQGDIVLSVGLFTHYDLGGHAEEVLGGDVKKRLDMLHLRKIDLADFIFVINPGGYIGDSTRREIEYAQTHDKPIRYLVPVEVPA